MASPLLILLLILLGLALLALLLWWLLIKTEGVYLGRGVVIWLYDLYASRYESIKGYEDSTEAYYLARPILQRLAPNSAPMVLDVATGTARLPRALTRQSEFQGRVVALDLSRDMLHYGAGRVAEVMHDERVYLLHAPAEQLPFPDASFDLVTCLEALEFMRQPKAVLAELIRVTRPGGLLVLTNRRGMDAKLMPFKTWDDESAYALYQKELGLEKVEIAAWQFDYDLVWAYKPGDSLPVRARALEEVWCCPRCAQVAMQRNEGGYHCGECGQAVPIAADGVIEHWGR
jgi:ubiquinone/menaquinone biosynthesis C-methylase UbiE